MALAATAAPALGQSDEAASSQDRLQAISHRFTKLELDPPAKISISEDGSTIFLVGRIMPGTFDDFYRSLHAHPKVKTAFVASAGGSVIDGYLIANAVKARKLTTHVEYMCASICPVIFAAGRERVLGRNAQLGFHRTFQLDDAGYVSAVIDYKVDGAFEQTLANARLFNIYSSGDDKVVRGLRKAGVSDSFIRKALEPAPEGAWYPTSAEVLAEGLATRLLDDSAGGTGLRLPASQQTLEEVSDKLAGNSFWQAVRTNEPALFAESAIEVWRAINSGVVVRNIELRERAKIDRILLSRLPTVPDALLEPFLGYLASLSRIEHSDGFPSCTQVSNLLLQSASSESITHRDASDATFVMLLENRVIQPRMELKKAKSQIDKNIRRLWETGVQFEETSGTEPDSAQECRQGLRVMDAIDRLAPKHRLPTFRAVISS